MAGKGKAIEQAAKKFIPIKPHMPTPAPAPRPAPGPTRNIGQEKALQQHSVNTATRNARQADLDAAFTGPSANAYFNRGAGQPAYANISNRGVRGGDRSMNRDQWKAKNRADRIQKKHGYDVNNLKNADEEVKAFTNGHVGVTNIKHASPHQLRDAHVQKELGQVHAGKMKMSDMSGAATMGELEGSFNQMNDARSGLAGVLKGASKKRAAVESQQRAAANAGPVSSNNMSEGEKWLATKRANKERGRQNGKDIAKQRVADAKSRLANPGEVHDGNAISHGLRREKDEAIVKRGEAAERRSARGASVNDPTASGRATTTPATTGAKVKSPKDSGRINLEAGGAATENLTGQITGTAKMMGDNIAAHVGAKHGGNYGAFIGKSALQGAVWGGAIGGTMSASQGGDFWAGAKEGAFKGAVGMAGYNSLKAGVKAKSFGDIGHNTKQVWNHHSVSKPVTAITRNATTTNVANQMMNQ